MPVKLYSTTKPTFKGETFKYQDQLPPLPVPSIEDTKARYLKSIKPFVTSEKQFAEHSALVEDFFNTQGKQLHQRLQELGSTERNWLSKFWDDYAYLTYTDPVVPYVSYFYGHRDLPVHLDKIGKNQIYKALAIIDKVLNFVDLIRTESLPAEVIKGTPFCMNSFSIMFNNSRIPFELGKDSNVLYSILENGFIVVAINGEFYKLFTHAENGAGVRLSINEIYKQLLKIIELSGRVIPKEPIGILTTLPREDWYKAYVELRKSPVNVASLDDIHKSTFIITLDEDQPITYEDRAHYSWHGNGFNRYFDKPVQFFIAKNGYSGFIAEHSKMDGTPTLLLNEFVNKELWKLNPEEFLQKVHQPVESIPTPKHLRFEVNPTVSDSITKAFENFESEISNHDVKVWHYNKYAKNEIKQFKQSPDAFIQMIIQLAYYKLTGTVVPTYEAASTRRFYHGRTEANRSVTEESLNFVRNWEDSSISDSQRYKDFLNAIKGHSEYIRAASAGQGVDRHFLGLKLLLTPDEQPHPLFSDPLFTYSGTWLISTSQLSSNYHDAYGWSEVNPIGWGLAYQINNDFLHVNICTRRSSGNKSEQLEYYLREAADEIFEVLNKEQKVAAKL